MKWLAFNAIGITAWLWVASSLWPPRGIEHCAPEVGDGITFFVIVVPFTCLLAIVNLAAIVIVSLNTRGRENRPLFIAILVTTIVWFGAAAFDYHKTFRYVTDECRYK